ncbi:MAG: hypothetical protein ACKOCK_12555 [Chloroflexota bacterium]
MTVTSMIRIAALTGLLAVLGAKPFAAPAQDSNPGAEAEAASLPGPAEAAPQPSYDTLRVVDGTSALPYHVWIDWLPAVVTTPDGGGWTFFGAQARAEEGLGPRQLWASRFDPVAGVWLPAFPVPGGQAHFGPAAAVDGTGVVHLVYADVEDVNAKASTLVHVAIQPDGTWSDPTPIAPSEDAGFQMMPSLAIDAENVVHVVWRDQRFVSGDDRDSHPANADLLSAEFADGAWSSPLRVMERDDAHVVTWPHVVVDGDRLIAVWSVYGGTDDESMKSAMRIDWASKPLASDAAWSAPAAAVEESEGSIGGRQVELVEQPDGGAILLYGVYERAKNDLRRMSMASGAESWGEASTVFVGDYGYMPDAVVGADDALTIVFNIGRNKNLEVGATVVDADGVGSPAVSLTPAEAGLQGRASVALTEDGVPWVVYMHQPDDETAATEIRALRGAVLK